MAHDTATAGLDPVDGPPNGAEPTPDVEVALELVRSNVLQLLSGFSRTPSVLRIRAGGVTVEAEWPAEPAAVNGGATTIVPTTNRESPSTGVAPEVEPAGRPVCAPAVGVFFHAPAPGAKPFVSVGDSVKPEQQLGIIEVMKLMIPVNAPFGGTVVAVLKSDGEPVEYDEQLMLIAPAGG